MVMMMMSMMMSVVLKLQFTLSDQVAGLGVLLLFSRTLLGVLAPHAEQELHRLRAAFLLLLLHDFSSHRHDLLIRSRSCSSISKQNCSGGRSFGSAVRDYFLQVVFHPWRVHQFLSEVLQSCLLIDLVVFFELK